ncbi:ciab protein [Helicobacter sp. MIT 00-7814]|uniref:invasion protein CiaB n=1 Tax=unclassified Helicobacter TaxID=2593540 RepID=UPI000E1FB3FD|nr:MULTISPECIES: invasion protein CiaB [unclassified Helicobacter]RDU51553.1 ciab protein [Helicobacter sp. MIT 00-7814]RDU56980.1 ciab protein [Helicobacter sp. MIT 99-10781]
MSLNFKKDIERIFALWQEAQEGLFEFYKVLEICENIESARAVALQEKQEILQNLCAELEIAPEKKHFVALVERIVALREDSILEVLKACGKDENTIAQKREFLIVFVARFYEKLQAHLLEHITKENLLTPFFREILRGVYEVGQCMNAFFIAWDRRLIQGINKTLAQNFSLQEAVAFLEPTMERDKFNQNAQRCYSLPYESALGLGGILKAKPKSVPYARAFPKEIGAVVRALEKLLQNLQGLEEGEFFAKDSYIAYFEALKNAFACEDSSKLIECWQEVDFAWMQISAPLQVGHPLEYYEDIYRHAVAPEWDLRLVVEQNLSAPYSFDIKQGVRSCFEFLSAYLGADPKMCAFVKHSIEKSMYFPSIPLLFFGAENNGQFSAQVVPNDEFVSKKEGKKIFAFPRKIIASARAKPKMRLSYEFFAKSFLESARKVLFQNPALWHSVYELSTNGHEFGHILWIDENTESAMNASGEFKNIEEFKATSGGILAYLLCHSPIQNELKEFLAHSTESKKFKNIEYAREAEPSGIYFREGDTIKGIESKLKTADKKSLQVWEAFFSDCVRRAVGLMAWRENLEVRPYYCEGLIHLCGMFESGVLRFDKAREFGKLRVYKSKYGALSLWYVRTYLSLARHYQAKNDAKAWLERYCKDYVPVAREVREFVEHYYERYLAIGREIYTDSH